MHLFAHSHGTAQVDGELADIEEGVLVGDAGIQGKQLSQCPLHEADEGQSAWRGELAVPHICDIHLLPERLQSEAPEHPLPGSQPSANT